ncbi:MAG: oligosaccharide flippase family protein [Actinomycetota bacterium]
MPEEQPIGGSARRTLGRDLVRYLPAQVIPAVIGFITIPIVTRLLDPAAYGDYRLVLATVGAFGAAGSWLASSIYRFYPEQELKDNVEGFRATVSRLLTLNIVVLALVWLIGLAIFWSVARSDLVLFFFLGLLLMMANQVWSVRTAQARALREVTWYSLGSILNKAITLGGGVALVIAFGLGVTGMLLGNIAGTVFLLPMMALVVRKRMPAGRETTDHGLSRDMFRYAYPLTFTALATWMLQLSDRYIIGALRGTAEVGLYTAAYGISEQSMAVILLMFTLPFAVLGSRVWEREGREAAADFVSTSARSYFLLAIPAWAGLSVLATPLMTVMTDVAYREAAVIVPLVAGGQLLNGAFYWFKSGSIFTKETSRLAVAIVWGAGVNLVLNLLLVGTYGYRIAAVTTLISYGVTTLVMVRWSRRNFPWKFPWVSVGRSILAAGVMAGALALIGSATDLRPIVLVAVLVPLGAAIYGGVLVLLGEREVIGFLRRMTSRLRSGSR